MLTMFFFAAIVLIGMLVFAIFGNAVVAMLTSIAKCYGDWKCSKIMREAEAEAKRRAGGQS